MGLFSGSFGTGLITGLASSVDRSMRDAITRRNSEMSEARKYVATRKAAKRDAYEAKKLKQDEANQLAFDALATQLGGDADLTYAAFKRLGTAEDVQSYLADVKTTRKALQSGEVYDPKTDFTGYQKGKTPVTREAALSDLSIPMPAISKISGSDLGIDDQIGRMFGREGQAADKAAARLNERFASDAPAARTPLTGTGTVAGIDLSRQITAQEAGFAATKRVREEKEFNMKVTAFDTNQIRIKALTAQIEKDEQRANRGELREYDQIKYDRARDEVKDLQTQSQLIQDAEAHVKNMEATDLSIEERKLAIAKEKKFPAFKSYENMAVFASNALATGDFKEGYTEQDYKDLYAAGIEGVSKIANAEETKAAGGVSFSKPNRQTILNNEIKRTLQPVGLVEDIEGKITFKIEGNKPLYFESMTRALDNVTAQTKDLEDPMMDALIKSQKDSLKKDIKAFKDAATPKRTTKQQANSSAFKSALKPGDVFTYTTANGKIITRLWTGRELL